MLCTVLCLYSGLTAARNMLGRKEEINTIPFFWTSQYGKSIRYCGKLNSLLAHLQHHRFVIILDLKLV